MRGRQQSIDIYVDEREHTTRAEVLLRGPDETSLVGIGTARRHQDEKIGDELAIARALADLTGQLVATMARGRRRQD
jgi:hypothetical protein